MTRLLIMTYSLFNYVLGVAALLYLIGFLFNLFVPKTIDGSAAGEAGASLASLASDAPWLALLINLGLIALFGLQHSIMARPRFKAWLTRVIPAPAERATFMLATAVVVFALCLLWQPLPAVLWQADAGPLHALLLGIGLAGWALVLYASFLINHFDLFGLRQAWLHLRGVENRPLPFKTRSLYRYIRHPIMTGALIGIWVTPVMTVGHLLFALGMTAYVLLGVYHEEKDLIAGFGARYRDYIRSTGRFFPRWRRATPVASRVPGSR